MNSLTTLQRGWHHGLREVLNEAKDELTISTPYISSEGTAFLLNSIKNAFKKSGHLTLLTDLSPANVCQGATDPDSVNLLLRSIVRSDLWHLPRLHAKVYVVDNQAIVTSGNLTAGGLFRNFEYGVQILNPGLVKCIRDDLISYSRLGANVTTEEILSYCEVSGRLKAIYQLREKATRRNIATDFGRVLNEAQDRLLRLRLAEGAPHRVFERTSLYLLRKNGPLSIKELHRMIEEIHPDLCDNSIDRVIDGKRFGKKWKHAVRTSQQHLKKKGLIHLEKGKWCLTDG